MLDIVNERAVANFHGWSNFPIIPGPLLLPRINFNLSMDM